MSRKTNKCLGLLCFFMGLTCVASNYEMFLNSHAHCGPADTDVNTLPYKDVGESTIISIKDDVSPNTNTDVFRECRIVFRSQRKDGRLCLMQKHFKIQPCEVRLELFDGWAGVDDVENPNVTIDCDHRLTSVEWCTTGRYFTLGVAKHGLKPSMKTVEVDFEVYDIRNKNRQVFMDSMPNCGSKFQLDSSQVTVSNINPNNHKTLFHCTLTFDYVGLEENRTVCLIFQSGVDRSQCSNWPYKLTVLSQQLDQTKDKLEYSCEKTLPERWCSNGTSLRLELYRNKNGGVQNETEKPNIFSVFVMDHIGGADTLPLVHKSMSSPVESSSHLLLIILVAVILSLALLVSVFICIYFHICQKPKGVQRVSNQDDGSSKTAMITNGTCRNGQMV
ncbi:uncharacterized protein LOC112556766 isoform X2 [Pomacea canaliculata]|nr:uncharacterized protein LOC112556766 isoform X2 [Pomacea canaliculata]XP_025081896.1 uncharacterized protein LOC112556766 isoform X2 [Pomacea canaliculata]